MTEPTNHKSDPANNSIPPPLMMERAFSAGESEMLARLNERRAEERAKYAAREHVAEPKSIAGVVDSIIERIDAAPKLSPEQIAERDRRRNELERHDEERERKGCWYSLVGQIGRRYEEATLDSYEVTGAAQRSVLDCVREYAGDVRGAIESGRNVVLYGPPGTGKDHLLAALMRIAISDGWSVVWRDGQSLCGEFRDAIDAERSEAELITKLTKASVLAISDPVPPLGSLASAYQLAMLFRVIDRRYRDLRPTWVTINAASAEEAANRISPNIIDRLGHGALVLRCNWASYRKGNP